MSNTAWLFVALILTHFVGDWFLQPTKMAMNKASSITWNCLHQLVVFLSVLPLALYARVEYGFLLALLYASLHGLQDWHIWRLYGRIRKGWSVEQKANDWLFYKFIATDQVIHLSLLAVLFVL